jgi:hypothetical protein
MAQKFSQAVWVPGVAAGSEHPTTASEAAQRTAAEAAAAHMPISARHAEAAESAAVAAPAGQCVLRGLLSGDLRRLDCQRLRLGRELQGFGWLGVPEGLGFGEAALGLGHPGPRGRAPTSSTQVVP